MPSRSVRALQVSDPIAEALFGKTRRVVLGLLFGQPDRSFYLREIVRETGAGLGAVQRELKRLESAGLLVRTPRGSQVYFAANRASPAFNELRNLLSRIGGGIELMRREIEKLHRRRLVEFAFIYGSVAGARQSALSDIDVMVIGSVTLKQLLPAIRRLQGEVGREINPSVYRIEEIVKKYASRDHFIRRIMDKKKLMLVGDEDELERMVQEPVARGT